MEDCCECGNELSVSYNAGNCRVATQLMSPRVVFSSVERELE
jgi:hypothetical protein